MNGQQISAAVQLATNFVLANLAFGGNRHVQVDVAVAGVQINVRCEVVGNFERDGTIATLQSPTPTHDGSGRGPGVDASVARLEFEFVEAAIRADVAVSGCSPQFAVYAVNFLGAVSAAQLHVAFEIGKFNLAIASMQVHSAFARHADVDVNSMIATVDGDAKVVDMRIAHIDLNLIAGLALIDANAVAANFVMRGGHFGFDRILLPGGDVNVGVGSIDAQVGRAGESISFRPLVSDPAAWSE
jgi:hypothetical protein